MFFFFKLVPSIRSGLYRLEVEFTGATNDELCLISYEEYPSVLQFSKTGNMLYYDTTQNIHIFF